MVLVETVARPATSARLSYPSIIDVDGAGNVFIADSGNNRVRKVTSDGVIITIAGGGTDFPRRWWPRHRDLTNKKVRSWLPCIVALRLWCGLVLTFSKGALASHCRCCCRRTGRNRSVSLSITTTP